MGRKAGQSLCPEYESFRILQQRVSSNLIHLILTKQVALMKTCTAYFINAVVIGIFNPSKHFAVQHADCLVHKHLSANQRSVSNNMGK